MSQLFFFFILSFFFPLLFLFQFWFTFTKWTDNRRTDITICLSICISMNRFVKKEIPLLVWIQFLLNHYCDQTLFSYDVFLRRMYECLKIFVPFIRCVHHFELSILHTRRTKLFTLFLTIEDIGYYLFLFNPSIQSYRSYFSISKTWMVWIWIFFYIILYFKIKINF